MGDESGGQGSGKKARSKEKKQRTGRKHESLKIWEYYKVEEGSVSRKRDNCPRCGPGSFLSKHKDRMFCGRCGYTQFEKGTKTEKETPVESQEQKAEETEKNQENEKPQEA